MEIWVNFRIMGVEEDGNDRRGFFVEILKLFSSPEYVARSSFIRKSVNIIESGQDYIGKFKMIISGIADCKKRKEKHLR